MGCITILLLLCNIALLIVADVALWLFSAAMGLYGLCGIIAFFIAYSISERIAISALDNFINPEFGVFIKKLSFANSTALMVWGGLVIITSMLGWESSVEFTQWLYN